MKYTKFVLAAGVAAFFWTMSSALAGVIVNDTWQDGDRTAPASPIYSEDGTDVDSDGDIESAWFNGGASTMTASTGNLSKDLTGSSANWTTYFTGEGNELDLNTNANKIRVTWRFSLTGVAANNTSQNFRVGIVDSIPANRISADGNPPGGAAANPYTGYALFANMGATLGNANPMRLMERVGNAGSNAILGTSGDWSPTGLTGTTNGATSGNDGFDNGTPYTIVWELTRNGAGIDIDMTLSGQGYNNSGVGTIDAHDANGNGFKFDTFNVRPSTEVTTASVFNTSLFRVEYFTPGVPEPASLTLLALSAMALAIRRRS